MFCQVEITVGIVCCITSLSVCKEQSKCVDLMYKRYDMRRKLAVSIYRSN